MYFYYINILSSQSAKLVNQLIAQFNPQKNTLSAIHCILINKMFKGINGSLQQYFIFIVVVTRFTVVVYEKKV